MYGHPVAGYQNKRAKPPRWRASTRHVARQIVLIFAGLSIALAACAAISYVPSDRSEVSHHG